MAHRHKAHRRAAGGSMKGRESFVSAPTEREAKSTKDKFKHGGLKAFGHKSKARADKKARGGASGFAKGGASGFARGGATKSPFSSAAKGNDKGRFPSDADRHQPRAAGGRAFKRGGGVRPAMGKKHEYNFGGHGGLGHEEGLQRSHPPVHHKHGGPEGPVGHGSKHHAGHGGHKAHHPHHDGAHPAYGHHSHKAKGKKHRAHGGKVEDD